MSEEAHEESALIVAVPEVEALVAPFRARHDPAAAKGVPAHVTVLYPFVAPARITPTIVLSLAELFAALPELRVSFAEVRRFPEALYLAPEPAEPLRKMTERVFERFPGMPPYEGRFADVIPHLTGYPAPLKIGTQIYAQATMMKMIAQVTQSGKSINDVINWAASELEGFMRS